MPDAIITLTSDFGEASPYVAAMKGVILGTNPAARLIDLSHQIPPQDVRHAAYFLAQSVPFFPSGTIHVIVVDPGVGSERAILYVEVLGQRLLVPDNGCWTLLAGTRERVIRLAEPRYWRAEVSNTFHGRDIFAPVAGHLSHGLEPALLGPPVQDWLRLESAAPERVPNGIAGEVVFVDHFGNLLTNIPPALVERKPGRLVIGGRDCPDFIWGRTYSDAAPGRLLALVSSSGFVEVAVAQGNAAKRLGVGYGESVLLKWN
jgi:S-adenosylmethionine hydrolase